MIWKGVTLFSLAMLGAYTGWQVSDRNYPVVVYAAQAENDVPPGGTLRISYVLNRLRQCETVVDRAIVDSRNTRFVLDALEFSTGAGPIGQERYVSIIAVPVQAALGPAVYRTTSRFRCNAFNILWPIYSPSREVTFKVVP